VLFCEAEFPAGERAPGATPRRGNTFRPAAADFHGSKHLPIGREEFCPVTVNGQDGPWGREPGGGTVPRPGTGRMPAFRPLHWGRPGRFPARGTASPQQNRTFRGRNSNDPPPTVGQAPCKHNQAGRYTNGIKGGADFFFPAGPNKGGFRAGVSIPRNVVRRGTPVPRMMTGGRRENISTGVPLNRGRRAQPVRGNGLSGLPWRGGGGVKRIRPG